jgi:NADH pyrophosphatase NudC (nudix superfamily)
MKPFSFCPRCAKPLLDRDRDGTIRRCCPDDACGFVQYENPTPVVAAIVERDGCVILVQNKGWPGAWFGLVTGFLEKGEDPREGIVREIREELGLDANRVTFFGHYAFEAMNQLIIAYHVVVEGEWALGDELAAAKAVPIEKVRPWPMGTGPALADWLAARAAPSQR